jgi:adenine-specific DNA-methyltransferase
MDIETIRRAATGRLDLSRRAELGQFFTPAPIADFMAAMFTQPDRVSSLMEAGAGVGCLVHSVAKRLNLSSIRAWEIDGGLVAELENTLASTGVPSDIVNEDFILGMPETLASGALYDRVILNPPYRKIATASDHRRVMEALGVRTTNLYTSFVAACLMLMRPGGELVAIIPRSCLNGLYHLDFRRYMLGNASLDRIHVFNSRRSAFSDDAVLQENVIVKFTRNGTQGAVGVSRSEGGDFSQTTTDYSDFRDVVRPSDPNLFIRIPDGSASAGGVSLADHGIQVSTGPLVEFKALSHTAPTPSSGYPVISSRHLSSEGFIHPSTKAKINRILACSETAADIWPSGHYVVVKRISPKEARRRVVAYHVTPSDIHSDWVCFENRLNVFHRDRKGLSEDEARRLCEHLNSALAEAEFLTFSGNTQVNATDLRAMTYPASLSA